MPWLAGNVGEQTGNKVETARLAYQEEIFSFSTAYQELSVLQASEALVNQINNAEAKWAKYKNDHNLMQSLFSMLSFYTTQGVFLMVLVVTAGLVFDSIFGCGDDGCFVLNQFGFF